MKETTTLSGVQKLTTPSILLVLVLIGASACIAPHTRAYGPKSNQEKAVFVLAERRILPDDVRKDLGKFKQTLVMWSGIIKEIEVSGEGPPRHLRVLVEHHYWDWLEDYSIQTEIAFLSPRGEGMFEFSIPVRPDWDLSEYDPRLKDMIIVYGLPRELSPDRHTIILDYKHAQHLPQKYYGTDIWDYGRRYLLEGDRSDFKVLRVPM